MGLVQGGDVVVCDIYSHASTFDAIKLIGAKIVPLNPDVPGGIRTALTRATKKKSATGRVFVTVEGVRSIDGTVVNLNEMTSACKDANAVLVIDDAHALGVLGLTGKGTHEHFNVGCSGDIRVATCSKALGAQGAFVSGSQENMDRLRNTGNPHIFTCSMSHPCVAAIDAALDVLDEDKSLLSKLHSNRRYFVNHLIKNRLPHFDHGSAIIPIFLKEIDAAYACNEMFARGLFVNFINFPVIPKSRSSFLRVSMMSRHDRTHLDAALDIIFDVVGGGK